MARQRVGNGRDSVGRQLNNEKSPKKEDVRGVTRSPMYGTHDREGTGERYYVPGANAARTGVRTM
jgi:hypothetical protein